MKFKTFRIIAAFVCLGTVLSLGFCAIKLVSSVANRPKTDQTAVVTQEPAPVAVVPSVPVAAPAVEAPRAQLTQGEVRMRVEAWLTSHANRGAKGKLVDIMPSEPFRATAIRFPEADAKRWSNDPSQWSQIKLDLDRDGVDDEKWLLRNGETYKREVLDRSGKVIQTEYFK